MKTSWLKVIKKWWSKIKLDTKGLVQIEIKQDNHQVACRKVGKSKLTLTLFVDYRSFKRILDLFKFVNQAWLRDRFLNWPLHLIKLHELWQVRIKVFQQSIQLKVQGNCLLAVILVKDKLLMSIKHKDLNQ